MHKPNGRQRETVGRQSGDSRETVGRHFPFQAELDAENLGKDSPSKTGRSIFFGKRHKNIFPKHPSRKTIVSRWFSVVARLSPVECLPLSPVCLPLSPVGRGGRTVRFLEGCFEKNMFVYFSKKIDFPVSLGGSFPKFSASNSAWKGKCLPAASRLSPVWLVRPCPLRTPPPFPAPPLNTRVPNPHPPHPPQGPVPQSR